MPGILIDKFGDFLCAKVYNPAYSELAPTLLSDLQNLFPEARILIKSRKGDGNSFEFLSNFNAESAANSVAHEEGRKFSIRTDPRHDFGIYTDARAARNFVQANTSQKRVLNLFAYTCGFGVAAALGGATSVTNVDPNKDYLSWGKENAVLNGVDFRVLPDTAQDYLKRHIRRLEAGKDEPYDLIIVDPPAFCVGRDMERLLRGLWQDLISLVTASKPQAILLMCNDRHMREHPDFFSKLHTYTKAEFHFSPVPQSFDVTGPAQEVHSDDPFYVPPQILYGVRNSTTTVVPLPSSL